MAENQLTPEEIKKKKHADYMREYMRRNPEKREKASKRAKIRRLSHMDEERASKRRWRAENPEANHASRVRWQRGSRVESDRRHGAIPAKRMCKLLIDARKRAKQKGIEFDESLRETLRSNPPTNCVCCLATLEYVYTGTKKPHRRAPSLDRVDNAKGYSVGNVRVICWRCNAIKSDATLDEIEAVAAYMRVHL
jgi:hypothetical protein